RRSLRAEGHEVRSAGDGAEALTAAEQFAPDLVVLDLGLPRLDGMEVCRRLRAESDVPILMLTARTETDDRVKGLDSGADDYLPKPFERAELLARIRALLRRRPPRGSASIVVGDLQLNPDTREVKRGPRDIDLTNREFELLEYLARNQKLVVSRERLLEDVWGYDPFEQTNTIDVFISNLRRNLEADGHPPLLPPNPPPAAGRATGARLRRDATARPALRPLLRADSSPVADRGHHRRAHHGDPDRLRPGPGPGGRQPHPLRLPRGAEERGELPRGRDPDLERRRPRRRGLQPAPPRLRASRRRRHPGGRSVRPAARRDQPLAAARLPQQWRSERGDALGGDGEDHDPRVAARLHPVRAPVPARRRHGRASLVLPRRGGHRRHAARDARGP